MLVGQSTAEYVLVKVLTILFSNLGLFGLSYFYLALAIGGVPAIVHPFSIMVECIGGLELTFYLFWFLPYRFYLHRQKPAFPPPLNRVQRSDLLYKVLGATADIEVFMRQWMCGAHIDELRREDLKEWLLWALFEREGPPGENNRELEEYVEIFEQALDRKIPPGHGTAKGLRMNFQKFHIAHRSLMYYLLMGFLDTATTIGLLVTGFKFYRQPRSAFFKTFPFRPMTLLSLNQSASPNLSYWWRPHKSDKHRPIVFMHGIGVGLIPYLPMLWKIPKDVGILCIEMLPVSSRITPALPLYIDLMREIGDIVSQRKLLDFVFIGESYGTFYSRLFIESPYLSCRTRSVILIDPVSVLLHLPDVAYNFTKRIPVEANELQLYWAARAEPDISFTLGRRFCWRECAMWRDDLLSRPTTLIMGGVDCIVNTEAIASYVTKGAPEAGPASLDAEVDLAWTWDDREKWKRSMDNWTGEGLELVWLEGYDHGQGFMSPRMLPNIVRIIEKYCQITDDRKEEEIYGLSPQLQLPEPASKERSERRNGLRMNAVSP